MIAARSTNNRRPTGKASWLGLTLGPAGAYASCRSKSEYYQACSVRRKVTGPREIARQAMLPALSVVRSRQVVLFNSLRILPPIPPSD